MNYCRLRPTCWSVVCRSHLNSNGSTEITIEVNPLKTYVAIRDCTLKGQEANLPKKHYLFRLGAEN